MSGARNIRIHCCGSRIPRARRASWPVVIAMHVAVLATPSTLALTLSEYVTDVVQTNPLVREQVHVYRQVAQDEQTALSGWRPRIDVSASFGQFSTKSPGTSQSRQNYNSQQADLTVTQNLFNGFDTTNSVGQARARLSAAAYQVYDTADNIALQAVQAYLRAVAEQRLVNLAAQNVASHQTILSQLRELSERGITRRSDLEQTEGRLARAQASLIAEQNNFEDALTQLHTLLGRYVAPSELVEPANPEPVQDMALAPLLEEGLRAHPGIESARKNIEAAQFDYKRSRSANLPSLDLALSESVGIDVDNASGRTEEASVVLRLNYNIYRGGADQANQRKKVSVIHEGKAFLDRVRRQVIDTLRLAWSADRSLQSQLPFLDRHARKSLETVELYREEYLLQKRDLIDLLDAESELNSALSNQSEANYDAIAARYRVYEGLGALFGVLSMAVEVGANDLRIERLTVSGIDEPELPGDRDGDGVADEMDHCDNSPLTTGKAQFERVGGCAAPPALTLGMAGVDLTFMTVDDHFNVESAGSVSFSVDDLLLNDRILKRDRPEVRAYTQGAHGAVTSDGESTLTYAPADGFAGDDRFEYTVGDQRGRTSTASVHVLVSPSAAADFEQLYFNYKQDSLTETSRGRLQAVLARLNLDRGVRIEIRAYTDNVGSAGYNQKLSARRASLVQQMLEELDVDRTRIEARGEGENSPVASNKTEQGRALNRRVELRFVGSSSQ
ncbi:MAG: adhesin transport system outer membrane protein [Gammaproteobacteria bacterium]